MNNIAINDDCMSVMKKYSDKYFDLAIIDPPYGINEDGGKVKSRARIKSREYEKKNWDKVPMSKEYFEELFRVSKNQIIFGANHFISKIPHDSSCWIVWDKDNSGDFADCELAWTSFSTAVRKVKYRWNGMIQQDMKNKEVKIHPIQKPIFIYEWLLFNYAKNTDIILDTHLGSGSSRIAAYKAKLDFVGIEIDKDYFEEQENRFRNFTSQQRLDF